VSGLRGQSRTCQPERVPIVSLFFSIVVPGGPTDGGELCFDRSASLVYPPRVTLIFYAHVNSLTTLPRRGLTISMSKSGDRPGYSNVKIEAGNLNSLVCGFSDQSALD
jgi:hypothetical protein